MGSRSLIFHPGGQVEVQDTRTLDEARAEAVARAKTGYQERIAAGMTWQGKPLQIDPEATANMTAVVLQVTAGITLPPGFAWRMGDNTYLQVDGPGMVALASAAAARVQQLRLAMWTAVDQARAAATIEAADAVAAIWPEA